MKGEPKQVIVIRKDLKMRKGKIAAQAAHASLRACFSFARFVESVDRHLPGLPGDGKKTKEITLDITDPAMNTWWTQRFKKVVCYVVSEQELFDLYEKARQACLPCSLIRDAGDTEFHGEPTYTAVAIGPSKEEDIDPITGELPLL